MPLQVTGCCLGNVSPLPFHDNSPHCMRKTVILISAILLTALGLGVTQTLTSASEGEGTPEADSLFEATVSLIKRYETLHQPRHWPLVGYGHLVIKGEKFTRRTLSEKEADALLRKDLLKNCAVFRDFGRDSLLLGTLAYNIGMGNVMRSSVTRKLREGDRDIYESYIAHCRYKGRAHNGLRERRIEEFNLLFSRDTVESAGTPAGKSVLS